ncbi:MAG: CHAT domain-containing protein [Fimbriimonadales bacterium]
MLRSHSRLPPAVMIVFAFLVATCTLALGQTGADTPEHMALARLKELQKDGEWMPSLRSVFDQAKSVSKGSQALSRIKELSVAVLTYSNDSDDYLPPMDSDKSFHDAMLPYAKSEDLFIEEATSKPWARNESLSYKARAQIENPAETVMLYGRGTDANKVRCVGYADGHAKTLAEPAWRAACARFRIKFEEAVAMAPSTGTIQEPDPRTASIEAILAYQAALRRSHLERQLREARKTLLPAWSEYSPAALAPLCPNIGVAGKDPSSISAGIALLYEADSDLAGRRLVGFADGRISEISDADFEARRGEMGLASGNQLQRERAVRLELITEGMTLKAIASNDAMFLLPVLRKAKLAAQRTASLSNLKQLGGAVLMYLLDHDDVLPDMDSPEAIANRLRPYTHNEGILHDPVYDLPYGYVKSLGRKNVSSFESPANTPVLYEAIPVGANRAVVFLDSHVGRVSEEEFSRLMQPLGGIPGDPDRLAKLVSLAKSMDTLSSMPVGTSYDKVMAMLPEDLKGEFNMAKPVPDQEAKARANRLVEEAQAIPNLPHKILRAAIEAAAQIYEELGDFEGAQSVLGKRPAGGDSDSTELALMLSAGDLAPLVPQIEKAIRALDSKKAKNPADYAAQATTLFSVLGAAQLMAGDDAGAEGNLQTARECALQSLNPTYFAIMMNLEALYQQLGRRSQGFALLADSMELQTFWAEYQSQSQLHELIGDAEVLSPRQFGSELERIFAERARAEESLKLTAALIADPSRAENTDRLSALLGQSEPGNIYRDAFLASSILEAGRRYAEAGDVAGLERCLERANPEGAPIEIARVVARREKTALTAVLAARRGQPEAHLADLANALKETKLTRSPPLTPDRTQFKRLSRDLALVQLAAGRPGEALSSLDEVLQGEDKELALVLTSSSEEDAASFVDEIQKTLDAYITVAIAPGDDAGPRARAAASWVARRKGRVFETLARSRIAQRAIGSNPQTRQLAVALKDARAKLAETVVRGQGEDEASAIVNRLEAELAAKTPGLAAGPDPTPEALSARLAADEALVEYEVYNRPAYGPGSASAARMELVAFVYRNKGLPAVFALGGWNPVAADLDITRRYFAGPGTRSHGAAAVKPSSYEEYRAAATRLRQRLVDPLQTAMTGVKSLTICPDGELNRLSFEALPLDNGRYLAQDFVVSYICSCRDLLAEPSVHGDGVAIFSGPDYDSPPTGGVSESVRPPESISVRFGRLEGAEKEGQEIQQELTGGTLGPVRLFSGSDASESKFRGIKCRILHFATHGFVLPLRPPEERTIGVSQGNIQVARVHVHDNPLARSGLALAGANHATETASGDDGWLTAAEIVDSDLSGTDLVVLSACDTGLGQVRTGEGVFGLRRAFRLAGARNVIMSLVEVADEPTRAFMRDFYSGLRDGKAYLLAFHDAQIKAIAREGERGRLNWASFVFSRG